MAHQIVEVYEAFSVGGFTVWPGARLSALPRAGGAWVVTFNGLDVELPAGVVGPVGGAPAPKAAGPVYSDARMDQYQLAPAKPA